MCGRTLFCAGLITLPALAAAQAEPALPSIALITDQRDHPIVQRLLAELAVLRVNTVVTARRGAPSPSRVLSIVGRAHGVAALTVYSSTARIKLWLIDFDGPKVALSAAIPRGLEEAGLLTLRVIELLRARLIPLPERSRPMPVEPSSPEPAQVKQRGRSEGRPLAVEVSGGPTFAPGGLTPMAHLWLGVSWLAWPRVKLEVVGAIPLAAGGASGEEGTADVHVGLVALGGRFLLKDRGDLLVPSVGGGLGVCHLRIAGSAEPPLTSESTALTTAVAFVRGGLSLRLGWRARLNLDGLIGVLAPGAAVDFAGREAATWGRPLLGLYVGLEVGL